ncbi:ABC transporter substrate-binding protein [Mariniluteicoccus flavus]
MKSRFLATLATLAITSSAALALSGCGSNSLGNTANQPSAAGGSKPAKVNEALAAKLPEKVKSSKKIVVGTDATYAPNEFLDADGKTVVGSEVDLFNAVAAKLGVTVEWTPSAFDSIITGVQANKYDVGVSSFTINDKRKEQVNMVSYYNAGTLWGTAKGNPKKVDPQNVCGMTVAVQTGTVQEQEDLPARQAKCGDKKINILQFEGQDQATAAVVSGKADAMLADSPVVAYAVKQSGGKLEQVGQMYDASPYGFVVPKDQKDFAEALTGALTELKSEGGYEAALKKWGTEGGAISDFKVNP